MEIGSENVYLDLDFENPEEMHAKAQLVRAILKQIKSRNLTQKEAAKLLGVSQPDISKMNCGHFHKVTFDRLFRMLKILGYSPKITIMDDQLETVPL